jgi:hypothetical protein
MPNKNNTRPLWDGTMELQLTQGQWVRLDAADYRKVKPYRWCAQKTKLGYVAVTGASKTRKLMHRLITKAPDHLDVDHHNHNTLDNTRNNLRLCTTGQNMANRVKRSQSRFKGVSLHKPSGKYLVHILNQHIGLVEDELTASYLYDCAAQLAYGRFALLNHEWTDNHEPQR